MFMSIWPTALRIAEEERLNPRKWSREAYREQFEDEASANWRRAEEIPPSATTEVAATEVPEPEEVPVFDKFKQIKGPQVSRRHDDEPEI